MNSVNKIPLLSFCVKKANHSTYLTAGGRGDDNVHVSSVITPTLRSGNVWGSAFSNNKRYLLLLLSLCFGAMTTRFFLPTSRRLNLELSSYKRPVWRRKLFFQWQVFWWWPVRIFGRNTEFCMDFNSPLPFISFETSHCLGPII
jgi:hypothetical protein